MQMRTNAMVAVLAALLTSSALVQAADKAPTTQPASAAVDPALKADPAVLAAIDKLGDNSSVVLGDPTVMEELGDFAKGWHNMKTSGPTGRDFSIKMAWMPDRKRAFYCGANHGSPHRFNDAWEYDLPSNTWVLLYVPDYNDRGGITEYDKKTLVLKDGWLRTTKGGPAHPAHTWWGLTYDPNIKAAVWYCVWPPYRLKEKLDAIGKQASDLYAGPPIWCFYPDQKKWEPMPTEKPWPRNALAGSLEYVPSLGGALWQYSENSWLLDASKRTWKEVGGKKESLPIETLVCNDPDRKLMIAYRGPLKDKSYATWHNSLADGAPAGWVRQDVKEAEMPNGHDASSFMYFDPAGKVALLYDRGAKAIWSYDPDKVKWTKMSPAGPPPPFGDRERALAYMDTARNVFVVIGYDSVWCYRYKAAPAGQ